MGNHSDLNHARKSSILTKAVPSFVGRHHQLDWFTHRLQEAFAGHPRVVLLPGVAGIGKTRLLKEIQSLARHRGLQVCYGHG